MTATSRLPLLLSTASIVLGAGCAPQLSTSIAPDPGAAPYRVYDVFADRFTTMEEVAANLQEVDALFFGEFHDDAGAHQAQRDLLTAVAAQQPRVVLGFEMFERDVQPIVDRYLNRTIDEDAFLASARPWPNYRTDYRPLLELARERDWQVLATNLPQSLATSIGRQGLDAIDGFSAAERSHVASSVECPLDDYWTRFVATITGEESADGSAAHTSVDPALANFFQAQCARDSTMAEAVAPYVGDGPLLVHINGGFHTDFFLGLVDRLLLRRPEAVVRVISTVQLEDLAEPPVEEHLDRADYLVFTLETSE